MIRIWLAPSNPLICGISMWSLFDNAGGGGGIGSTMYAATGPPLTGPTWTVTHNLNTTDVVVQVYELATGQLTGQTVTRTSANVVTITSVPDMTANAFRVGVLAIK